MPLIDVNGAELFVESIGSGIPLLMMHGLGLDHSYLRPWHDELSDTARVIYYDHRLCGRSSRATGAVDHELWHADALALLDQLGIERAVVYGHSYGAWLAQGLAIRHPDRVAGLILCAATPAFDYPAEVIAAADARDRSLGEVLMAGMAQPIPSDQAFAALWRRILPLYFVGEPPPDFLAGTLFSAEAFTRGMQLMQGFDTTAALPSLERPILVVNGAHDFITPERHARRIVEVASSAELVSFASSGHFPFVEEPEAYVTAVRKFLRAHGS